MTTACNVLNKVYPAPVGAGFILIQLWEYDISVSFYFGIVMGEFFGGGGV